MQIHDPDDGRIVRFCRYCVVGLVLLNEPVETLHQFRDRPLLGLSATQQFYGLGEASSLYIASRTRTRQCGKPEISRDLLNGTDSGNPCQPERILPQTVKRVLKDPDHCRVEALRNSAMIGKMSSALFEIVQRLIA